jgi:hypothetical protein
MPNTTNNNNTNNTNNNNNNNNNTNTQEQAREKDEFVMPVIDNDCPSCGRYRSDTMTEHGYIECPFCGYV